MQTTMKLLETALAKDKNIATWTKRLGLSGKALYNAEARGHLSPAIAGALADELGKTQRLGSSSLHSNQSATALAKHD